MRRSLSILCQLMLIAFAGLGLLTPQNAKAALPDGTPLFTCTLPTQGLNTVGSNTVLVPLPATGAQAIKEIHFYIDLAPANVVVGPGGNNYVTGVTSITKVVPATTNAQCVWQTAFGDISSGNHTARATAADNSGVEGAVSNPLAFTVPAVVYKGPLAPGVSVQ